MDADSTTGLRLAVMAEALYLANLLLLPGIAFLLLWQLYRREAGVATPLARNHLQQSFVASLWAGLLLLPITLFTLLIGGYQSITAWTITIIYFTVCHATLVLLGVAGLAKALAGHTWRYPLIGPHHEERA